MNGNKYLAIYNEIAESIKKGEIRPNEKIPSENELVERYHTSRETIRKALNLLSQNGFIQKIKGKGSIVLDLNKFDFPISGIVSFKEIARKMDKPVKTIVHTLELIKADDNLKKHLNVTNRDKVWKVIRARKIDNECIILDKDYFIKKYVPTLTKEICEDSIYEYIENDLELKISFARREIFVDDVTEEDMQYLDLKNYSNVVTVKNYVHLEDASLFQYTESRHRLDKFRFVDFARRN